MAPPISLWEGHSTWPNRLSLRDIPALPVSALNQPSWKTDNLKISCAIGICQRAPEEFFLLGSAQSCYSICSATGEKGRQKFPSLTEMLSTVGWERKVLVLTTENACVLFNWVWWMGRSERESRSQQKAQPWGCSTQPYLRSLWPASQLCQPLSSVGWGTALVMAHFPSFFNESNQSFSLYSQEWIIYCLCRAPRLMRAIHKANLLLCIAALHVYIACLMQSPLFLSFLMAWHYYLVGKCSSRQSWICWEVTLDTPFPAEQIWGGQPSSWIAHQLLENKLRPQKKKRIKRRLN